MFTAAESAEVWDRWQRGEGLRLIVTEGLGWTKVEGGPKLEFQAGDILWCPGDHKHWHGATPHEAMTHIAIQESVSGSPVTLDGEGDRRAISGAALGRLTARQGNRKDRP